MSDWDDWLKEQKIISQFPERLRAMHKMYGKAEGKTCKNCKYLLRFKMGGSWMKCKLSNQTHGKATDWKAGWQACGKYEEK